MPFGNELFDPTQRGEASERVQQQLVPSDELPPPVAGRPNVSRFEAAFRQMLPGYLGMGNVTTGDANRWEQNIQGKILYLPRGRYRVENVVSMPADPAVTGADAWRGNLWDRYRAGEVFSLHLGSHRGNNPFAASLLFPSDITLWLAAGAVLVPEPGAIIHIASALVCERELAFDLRFGGLVVFGERTPKLFPEWWKAPGVDDATAIQHALDAGIHHRSNVWELPSPFPHNARTEAEVCTTITHSLPPIPVELRGSYDVGRTLEVRGGFTNTRLLDLIGDRGVRRPPGRPEVPGQIVPDSVLRASGRPPVLMVPARYTTQGSVRVPVFDPLILPADPYGGPLFVRTIHVADPGLVAANPISKVTGPTGPEYYGIRIEVVVPGGLRGGTTTVEIERSDGTREELQIIVDPEGRGRREVTTPITAVMSGAWSGRAEPGARLTAAGSFLGPAVLRLVYAGGFTLRNLAVVIKPGLAGVRGLDLRPTINIQAESILGMAVERCLFEGTDTTLVQIGDPVEVVFPADLERGLPPIARLSNYGADMSGLVFDRCDFRPGGRATAVAARTDQAVPFRFQGCTFEGEADAMIDFWKGTCLFDHCTFENRQPRRKSEESLSGFEPPDGVDIYLRFELPTATGDTRLRPLNPMVPAKGTLAAFTAVGCVSRSRTFLASPTPWSQNTQQAIWPLLLLNVRHLPSTVAPGAESIRWFLRPQAIPLVQPRGELARARLGSMPLAVVGGQFAGDLTTSDNAAPCAIVGARNLSDGRMRLRRLARPAGINGYFAAFVLPIDQRDGA